LCNGHELTQAKHFFTRTFLFRPSHPALPISIFWKCNTSPPGKFTFREKHQTSSEKKELFWSSGQNRISIFWDFYGMILLSI